MERSRGFKGGGALLLAIIGLAGSLVLLIAGVPPGHFPLPLIPEPAAVLSLGSALCAAFDVLACAAPQPTAMGRRLAGWAVLQLSAVCLGWSLGAVLASATKLMHGI